MSKIKLIIIIMGVLFFIAYVTTFNCGGCGGGGGSSGSSTPPTTTPPSVATLPATNVTLTTATLNGTVNPNGVAVSVCFQFGTSTAYGSTTASQNIGSGTTPVTVTATLSGLSPDTTYNFRIRVTIGSGGTGIVFNGANQTFTTGLPPTCATNPATNITTNSATLNGTVYPNGATTNAYFNYGLTTSYTVTTTSQTLGSGVVSLAISATVSSLTSNAEYNFRVVGSNSFGTTYGTNLTFTAIAPPPTCTTQGATNVTANSATLNGIVNPNGANVTSCYFDYGTQPISYGLGQQNVSSLPGSGTNPISVTANVSSLANSTLYNCRVVATNSSGTTNGNNRTFTTGAPIGSPPTCTTDPADNITYNFATLNGTVNPNGTATQGYFQWGLTASYTETTTAQAIGSGVVSLAVSATAGSLTPNTLYNFRVVATNSGGTTNGLNQTFTTGAPPTPTTVSFVQQPTNTTAGTPITPPVTVRVTDQYNSPLSGIPVYMIVSGGSPTLYGTLTGTTDASGIATFNNLSIQVAGTNYRLRASLTP